MSLKKLHPSWNEFFNINKKELDDILDVTLQEKIYPKKRMFLKFLNISHLMKLQQLFLVKTHILIMKQLIIKKFHKLKDSLFLYPNLIKIFHQV